MMIFLMACGLMSATVQADDVTARSLYNQALALWEKRAPIVREQPAVRHAVELLGQATAEANEPLLKFDSLFLKSKAYYWLGLHTDSRSQAESVFEQAMQTAEEAANIREFAEAYFFYGIALGRWAQARGLDQHALERRDEMIQMLQLTKELTTRDGNPGASYEGWGADRALGILYLKLPFFAGGSLREARLFIKVALDHAPENALNVVSYYEALIAGNFSERREGCRQLKEFLKNDPYTYNPNRTPETVDEFDYGKKVLKESCWLPSIFDGLL